MRVGEERKIDTLELFFNWFGTERAAGLRVVCSDMWKAYLAVIRKRAGQAPHVLDRFHVAGKLGEMIDKVRAAEARELKMQGKVPVLKRSRWLLLKHPEDLSEAQQPKLPDLLRLNLRTVRVDLPEEDFQQFWERPSPTRANRFLSRCCRQASRSRLAPAAAETGPQNSVQLQVLRSLRTRLVHTLGEFPEHDDPLGNRCCWRAS